LPQLVVVFLGTIIKRWHHKQMAHVLWQQRCLEVASRLHHVGVVDETRRTYRHHGRQHDAPRRIARFRHATLRVAPHRYATLEPLGKPGGLRAFSADGPPQAPVAPRRSCVAKYMRADELAASRRAVIERRYRLTARALINQKVGRKDPAPGPFVDDRARIVELASCVGPARCQYDVARRGQPLEASIAVDLQHTTEVLEMGRRTLCLAIGAVEIDGGRRFGSGLGSIVARIDPQPACLGAGAAGS
jgi:hypothetical protein